MNMTRKIIFTFVASMIVTSVFSQGIEGRVVDSDGRAIENASVALLLKEDSSFIASTTTDGAGSFHIASDMHEGILAVSFIGYKMEYKPFAGRNVDVVKLEEEGQMLADVTIKGSRIVNKANGYSFRPSGSGLENVNTAQEMFAFLPAITVKGNKIQLFDKYPTIYVNGVKITSQDELASLSPRRIDKIEVTYLSIGESVDNKGGVIRVMTKKDKNAGYSGYLRESVGEMTSYGHIEDAPTIVLSASLGKWTFNYYTVYSHKKLLEDVTCNYAYDTGEMINMDNKTRSWENYVGGRLNVSYELSKSPQSRYLNLLAMMMSRMTCLVLSKPLAMITYKIFDCMAPKAHLSSRQSVNTSSTLTSKALIWKSRPTTFRKTIIGEKAWVWTMHFCRKTRQRNIQICIA